MKKVSILMPCYNDGRYLEEALCSIEKQTWRDIEVIIVDDESDDPYTLKKLNEFAQNGRCQLFTQKRKGPSEARNLAFSHATGEFVLPLDADDTIEPDYIEKAVAALEKNRKAGVCYCHADFFGELSGKWELPDYSLRHMLVDNVVFVSSVIRREAFEQVNGYNSEFITGMEDYDFYLSVLENGWEIIQLPEVLFHYRIKKKSRSQKLTENMEDYFQVYRMLYEKHRELYVCHADEVIPDLREAFLSQRKRVIELETKLVKQQPIWKRIVRRVLK